MTLDNQDQVTIEDKGLVPLVQDILDPIKDKVQDNLVQIRDKDQDNLVQEN